MAVTLAQAIRNAIEAERHAERFYRELAARTEDDLAVAFLARLAEEEADHARAFVDLGRRVAEGHLPAHPTADCEPIETLPEWVCHPDITFSEAIRVAIEAESHAALYYDAVADLVPAGEVRDLFRSFARLEEQHAAGIRRIAAESWGV